MRERQRMTNSNAARIEELEGNLSLRDQIALWHAPAQSFRSPHAYLDSALSDDIGRAFPERWVSNKAKERKKALLNAQEGEDLE